MVSYKRLNPEEVQFSGAASLEPGPEDSGDMEMKAEDPDRPLLDRRPHCSATIALLTLGGLILAVLAIWLLGTVVWLRGTPSTGIHKPPLPVGPRYGVSQPESCSSISEACRFDCYPEKGVVVTKEMCNKRNCCFIQVPETPGRNGVPWCFYPPDFPSYELVAISETEMGYRGKLIRRQKTYYPKDVETLQLDVLFESDNRLRVKVR